MPLAIVLPWIGIWLVVAWLEPYDVGWRWTALGMAAIGVLALLGF